MVDGRGERSERETECDNDTDNSNCINLFIISYSAIYSHNCVSCKDGVHAIMEGYDSTV